MENKRNKAVIGVLLMVFLFFVILMIFAAYTVRVFKNEDESSLSSFQIKDRIGVVEISGVILESKNAIELLQKAERDTQIKAIIVRIDSPGGAVGPTQEIYSEIIRIDKMADDKENKNAKPIFASFGTVAASGGYYIGAAARRIYANPGTLTGSIGVIMQFMDLSKLYELAKLNPQPIKSGRYKDIGQPYRPISSEEKDMMEELIGGVHKQFVQDIMRKRAEKIVGDINLLAQGQIFSGEKAIELGLVDRAGGIWDAAREIHKELNLKGDVSLKYVKNKKQTTFFDIVDSLDEAVSHISMFAKSMDSPVLMFK